MILCRQQGLVSSTEGLCRIHPVLHRLECVIKCRGLRMSPTRIIWDEEVVISFTS